MHDVISKTLPHQTPTGLEEIARLSALWGQDAMNGAAKAVGMAEGELWSWARLKQVDDHLQTLAAMRQDSAMLDRDEPKTAPEPAAEDPLVFAASDAIKALREHMFECAIDEVQNTWRRDPDYSRADAAEAHLLKAIDDLIADRLAASTPKLVFSAVFYPEWQHDAADGLLIEHKPGARVNGGAL